MCSCRPRGFYVQAGSFADLANAHALRKKLRAVRTGFDQAAQVNGSEFYRVMLGPWATREEAETAAGRLDQRSRSWSPSSTTRREDGGAGRGTPLATRPRKCLQVAAFRRLTGKPEAPSCWQIPEGVCATCASSPEPCLPWLLARFGHRPAAGRAARAGA